MTGQQKPGAPVVGFNHNIPYKGRTFHVQTEDSGPQHAHVITHVFLGGNILASTKNLYADLVSSLSGSELFAAVRKRMEEQHKAMMRELLQGKHDEEIARRSGGGVYEPGVLAGGEKAPGLLVGGENSTPKPSTKAPTAPGSPTNRMSAAPSMSPLSPGAAGSAGSPVPQSPRGRSAPASTPPAARSSAPPPPLPRKTSAPVTTSNSTTNSTSLPPAAPTTRNEAPLFGDGLISNRRLDEVILSYLATDPEATDKNRKR